MKEYIYVVDKVDTRSGNTTMITAFYDVTKAAKYCDRENAYANARPSDSCYKYVYNKVEINKN